MTKYIVMVEHEYIAPGGVKEQTSSLVNIYERKEGTTDDNFLSQQKSALRLAKACDPTIIGFTIYEPTLTVKGDD